MTGGPPFKEREEVIVDLLIFDLNLDQIAEKYDTSPRTVYRIAQEAGIEIWARSQIMRQIAVREELTAKIESDKKLFLDAFAAKSKS